MPSLHRRQFIRTAGAAVAVTALTDRLQAAYTRLDSGGPDWNLQREAKPASVELAKSIGFDGVQISLGHSPDPKIPPEHLPVGGSDLFEQYHEASRKNNFPIASTCVEILHRNYLKNDPLGKKWVAESIPLTKRLGARVILLPFFGNGALQSREEMEYVRSEERRVGKECRARWGRSHWQ